MCDEDRSTAERLAKGELQAWEDFCREYSGALLALVHLRFGCSMELAEEIVHLTFIRCVRGIKSFDPSRGRLFGWLSAIARNEARTALRKVSLREAVELSPDDQQLLEHIDEAELPDECLCRKEVRCLILETVMGLETPHRRVLAMKYLENRRVSDIAGALSLSEKAVESLLTRSRKAFKERLLGRFKKQGIPAEVIGYAA